MFESVIDDGPAARLRTAALWPAAAFLIAQGYLTLAPFIAPLVGHAIVWLFWLVALLCVAGTAAGVVIGLVTIIRRRSPLEWRGVASLVVLIGAITCCAWTAASMIGPWVG